MGNEDRYSCEYEIYSINDFPGSRFCDHLYVLISQRYITMNHSSKDKACVCQEMAKNVADQN
jgi:hypothetical protein